MPSYGKNEYNQASGKTRRIMTRLKAKCRNSDCDLMLIDCDRCKVVRESFRLFGYNVLADSWDRAFDAPVKVEEDDRPLRADNDRHNHR